MIEYRPLCRLLYKLAKELKIIGKNKESIKIYEFLQEYIESDNLGVGVILLNEFLKQKTLPKARLLLDKYSDYETMEFIYGEMIYHFLIKDKILQKNNYLKE